MRAFLTFLFIVIIFSVVVGPYADGYLVKRIFTNNIEQLQAVMQSQHGDTELALDSYDLGWFESKAVVSIRDKNTLKTKVPLNFVIHHGPVVFIDSQLTMALAYITCDAQSSNMLPLHIKLSSVIPYDQHINITKFSVDPVQLAKTAKWDGLTGETTIIKNGNLITDINTRAMIGKIIGQDDTMMGPLNIELEPSTLESKYQRTGSGEFTSNYKYQAGSMKASAAVGNLITVKSAALTGMSSVKSNLFNTQMKLQLATINFNPEMSASLQSISDLTFTFNIDNLNQANLLKLNSDLKDQKAKAEFNYLSLADGLINTLTSKTTLTSELSVVTPEGKSSAQINIAMTGAPKSIADLSLMSNGKIEIHVTKPFFNEILKHVLSTYMTAQVVAPSQTDDVATPAMPTKTVDPHAYYQGIADLVKSGAITTNQSISLMSLPEKKLDRNALDTTLDPMGLTPTAKASVIALYAAQFLADAPPPPSPPTPPASSSASLMDPEALINSLIEKGVIKDEGNAYTLVVEKTGPNIKVNGSSDVQTLLQELFALSSSGDAAVGSASTNDLANRAISMVQSVSASADALASGNYTNNNVTMDNIKSLMPNGSLDTPWGTGLTFSAINATSYKVALPGTPEDVCKQLSSRLVSNPKFTNITPITDCAAAGTDFTYIYDSTK